MRHRQVLQVHACGQALPGMDDAMPRPILSAEKLKELGLQGILAGAFRDVEPGPDPVARGWMATPRVGLQGVCQPGAELHSHPLELSGIEETGIEVSRVEEDPWLALVRSTRGALRVAGEKGGGWKRVAEDAVYLDLGVVQELAFIAEGSRAGLLLARDEPGPARLQPFFPSLVVEGPATVTCPIERWLSASSDAWLVDLVRRRLQASDGPLDQAVAAGLLARLEERPVAEIRASAARLEAGEYEERMDRERAWARSLRPEQLETVEWLAVEAADHLRQELPELGLEPAVGDAGWRACMLGLFHLRDDLQGVWLLLREAGRGERLGSLLEALDREARRVLLAVPIWPEPASDQRLLRAIEVDPDGWWVEPATWTDA